MRRWKPRFVICVTATRSTPRWSASTATIWSPSISFPPASTASMRSPSPSNATPRSAPALRHDPREEPEVGGAAAVVDVRAVGRVADHRDRGAQPLEGGRARPRTWRRWRSRGRRAGPGAARRSARRRGRRSAPPARAPPARRRRPHGSASSRRLDRLLLGVLELPAAAEELDPVVLGRVVGGGDDGAARPPRAARPPASGARRRARTSEPPAGQARRERLPRAPARSRGCRGRRARRRPRSSAANARPSRSTSSSVRSSPTTPRTPSVPNSRRATSASPGNAHPPLTRNHAAPAPTLALAKAASLGCGRAQTLGLVLATQRLGSISPKRHWLPLRELRRLAGLVEAGLLALDDARVAREEALALEDAAELRDRPRRARGRCRGAARRPGRSARRRGCARGCRSAPRRRPRGAARSRSSAAPRAGSRPRASGR